LQENHKRFSDKYFETLNASESAIYAGFSEATSRQKGWELLQREDIQSYLGKLRVEYQEKSNISKERILEEYKKIAFSDLRDFLTVDGGLRDVCDLEDESIGALASIESFEVIADGMKIGTNRKIKLHDKLRALEALSKHLGLFEKDNQQSKPESTTIVNLGTGLKPDETPT
jgi:phage terminase small subunit